MSKFRAEVDIMFGTETDAVAFLTLLQEIKAKMFVGTGDEKIAIFNRCRYHECFHDEIPPKPCGGYVNYNLSTVDKEEIKTKSGDTVSADTLLPKKEEVI